MGVYIETGVGKGISGKDVDKGREAAAEALSGLQRFTPSLAVLFVSPELDIEAVHRGVREIIGDCPLIGTTTAGEIANGHLLKSVVVAIIASPHLRVRVGMGREVSLDYRKAVRQALAAAEATDYFSADHPLHQMVRMSTSKGTGVSPVFVIVFSPGATKTQVSLSHDIHTELRKASVNRIPIFGGSSADYFHFETNSQIFNDAVVKDAIVLAFVEAEILFGFGMAHGFSPTTKRALITKASGHFVEELDGRPAIEVCAELLEMPVDRLGDGVLWFSQFPFGTTDVYGNSLLHVPECVVPDGSIQFGPVMRTDQVLTLMKATGDDVVRAGLTAYSNALRQGGLSKPCFTMILSCALRKRLMGANGSREVDLIYRKAKPPVCGCYTFGEQGVSEDGLPVYSNQSVSALVFSDELNPVTALMYKGKRIYHDFTSRLNKKETQMKVMSKINSIIQEEDDPLRLLSQLSDKLSSLFPWGDWKFYLSGDGSKDFSLAGSKNPHGFPPEIEGKATPPGYTPIFLDSHGRRFGLLLLRKKPSVVLLDEEDMVLARTIGRLTARGLHRIEIDRRLMNKLMQLEILNHLSHEISRSITANTKLRNIMRHVRRILGLSTASLWLIDPTHQFLIKEASSVEGASRPGLKSAEADERLARWQIENCRPISVFDPPREGSPVDVPAAFAKGFVSLPIAYKGQMRGIMNLFWRKERKSPFQCDEIEESMEFLAGITSQLGVFIENRYLQKNTTFLKEIHHRVKNNLQNVASILRLQIRRLEGTSAEQALSDSISRIMSIAVVHETLCQGEIGMVDLRRLIDNVCELCLSGHVEPTVEAVLSGPSCMIPSREATSLALIVNELIQNVVRHGYKGRTDGSLAITLGQAAHHVVVTIEDQGAGLPDGFDTGKDGNLGLTIVRTLVKDDLRGRFQLNGKGGTTARIMFPLPKNYYNLNA
ncbi:MAG TPA: FIST N-terminal domain-containing protein [Syntrophorhabdaceae bacterium]|jgi:two-component sensor histidine kinase